MQIYDHVLYKLNECYITGEGVAFGNLSIGQDSKMRKSAVTLRSNTCVDIHILHLKDLKELLELYPQFKEELVKKTNTILKKTVLTSQVRSCDDCDRL